MRILELYGQEFARLRGNALIEAILSSEGRTLIAEVEGISSSAHMDMIYMPTALNIARHSEQI